MVKNLVVRIFETKAVMVFWERIEVDPSESTEYYYVIYYERLDTHEPEMSVTVTVDSNSTIIGSLDEGAVYQFAIAVSRSLSSEVYTGKRSSPQKIPIGGKQVGGLPGILDTVRGGIDTVRRGNF